jgi:uncharacterized protein
MPVTKNVNFRNYILQFSGDLQTIIPALFRKVEGVNYKRERIFTPDEDFLDLDWSFADRRTSSAVIISHGLEGDSRRPYVLGMARTLNLSGYDVLAWNFRGCSGELNKKHKFYHSGETHDLSFVIDQVVARGYKNIFLVGFSVGGNKTLKYLGEKRNYPSQLKAAAAFSVPCHLESVAFKLSAFRGKIYLNRFIRSLKKKLTDKALIMPDLIDVSRLNSVKDFLEFDNFFTAPVNGYKDAFHYWTENSSLYFLHNISIPTLLVNARNDPFLSPECFPEKEAAGNPDLFFEIPETGGHCGFYDGSDIYWSERRAVDFFKSMESGV